MIVPPSATPSCSTVGCDRKPYWAWAYKRIMRAGPLAIELEADLFSHIAKQQQGASSTKASPMPICPHRASARGFLA